MHIFLAAGFLQSSILNILAEQAVFIMFIPYLAFLYNQTTSNQTTTQIAVSPILAIILIVNYLIQNIIVLTGIAALTDLAIITNCLNIICLAAGFYLVFNNKKAETLLYQCFGIGSLIFTFFYLANTLATADSRVLFMIGFLAFAVCMHLWYCKKFITAIQAQTKDQILKEHAYIDYQTNYGSRLAFDQYYYCLDNYYSGTVQIGILVVDLNNLKETNDTYGNPAGDELIKGAAECIEAVFGEDAKYFRTGGDEFAVLTINSSLDMETLMHRLDSKVIEYNANHVHQLSLARGLCIDEADVNDEDKLRIIYKAADDRMYGDKIQKHEQMKVQMIQEKYLKKQMLQEQMIREKQFQEQMKKVAEAKEAEDLRKKQTDPNQTDQTTDEPQINNNINNAIEDDIAEAEQENTQGNTKESVEDHLPENPASSHADFWNEKQNSKRLFGKENNSNANNNTISQEKLSQTDSAEPTSTLGDNSTGKQAALQQEIIMPEQTAENSAK